MKTVEFFSIINTRNGVLDIQVEGKKLLSCTGIQNLNEATNVNGKGYFAECGLRNAESCQGVICGKWDADFFLRNEG